MTRAEQRALEAYPVEMVTPSGFPDVEAYDCNALYRARYIEAYHQAEKDNELTWDDIESIIHIYEVAKDTVGDYDKELYSEVLRRFKEYKEKRQ